MSQLINAKYLNPKYLLQYKEASTHWLGVRKAIAELAFNDLIVFKEGYLQLFERQCTGVVSYVEREDNFHICAMASSGTLKGSGTMLLRQVAQHAADKHKGLDLDSTSEAIGFYLRHGFVHHPEEDTLYFRLSPAKVKALARGVEYA